MTCRCTEADQERRNAEVRARLQQFEADQRARQAEEEELRRAMAAVEAAERQLREEREAEEARMEEEAREIARREAERVQQVAEYFEYLHRILERVRLQQETAIERRHDRAWAEVDEMRVELDSPERVAERKAHVDSERDKINARTESSIKTLQRQHAAIMIEMINRHRKDQDELLARSTGDQDSEILNAETLQELMPFQDLERASLNSQQAREIEKWKSREEDSLKAFDLKMLMVNLRQEEAGKIKQREQEIQNMIFADGKWTEVIFEERYLMLEEDEKKMVRNGGEAPTVPKPEPLVKQGKYTPALRLQTQQQQAATHQALTPSSVKEDSPMAIVGLLVKETGHKSTAQVERLSVPERWSRGNDELKMKNRVSGFVARW